MLQNQEKQVILLLEYYEHYKKICVENEDTWLGMDKDIWESVLVEYGSFNRKEINSLPNLFKAKQLRIQFNSERAEIINFHQRLQDRKSKESNLDGDQGSFKPKINIQYSQGNK
mgnify:FL=1|tara:strand:+ start:1170 stop:1511 length:342 start_codon:yes stop_codon:yes gene_type:complete